jgi:hypothetical protein
LLVPTVPLARSRMELSRFIPRQRGCKLLADMVQCSTASDQGRPLALLVVSGNLRRTIGPSAFAIESRGEIGRAGAQMVHSGCTRIDSAQRDNMEVKRLRSSRK